MKFSPSALQDFQRCPRCFWLARVRHIKPPRGIYPSLPAKMDELLKAYYDYWRKVPDLPEEIRGQIAGQALYTPLSNLLLWREWKTALVATDGEVEISGMLDDALQTEQGTLSVLDYKTKGDPPDPEYSKRYYQVAADCYDYMLTTIGDTSHNAYFVYYFPKGVAFEQVLEPASFAARLGTVVQRVEASPERAIALAHEAQDCLNGGLPPAGDGCEMCAYVNGRVSLATGVRGRKRADKRTGGKHGKER